MRKSSAAFLAITAASRSESKWESGRTVGGMGVDDMLGWLGVLLRPPRW